MYDDLALLLRPVEAGLCSYESLHRTDLTLLDFGIMNDWLDVKAENERRTYEWLKRQQAH